MWNTPAAELRARHGVRADVLVTDLTVEHAATVLREQLDALGLQADLLINNAGLAAAGRFEQTDPATNHAQAMFNVAVVDLTHHILPPRLSGDTAP